MFTDRLEVLREQNRLLLTQVKQQREKLGPPRGSSSEKWEEAEVVVTRTDGDCGPARAALAKPSVRFAGNKTAVQHKKVFTQSWAS